MIFGNTILGYDQMSVPSSISHIDDITSTSLSNAYMDDFYLTKDTEYIMGNTVPSGWDDNTILDATYESSLSAGNVDVNLGDYTHYIIKRRNVDGNSNKWITLFAYELKPDNDIVTNAVNDGDNPFENSFVDYSCIPGDEYEYAVVFAKVEDNGSGDKTITEGDYYTVNITPDINKLVICTSDELWSTALTDGFCDNQRNTAPGVVNTLNDKYPTIVDNSVANYETVNVTAEFYPTDENGCIIFPDNPDDQRATMRDIKKFKDFLMNRKSKILKNIDGRMWFCYVSTPPSDNARDIYYLREISFGVTEIADIEDQEELYNSGFINAGEEWWNT